MKILCLFTDIFFLPAIREAFKDHEVQVLENYKDEKFDLLIIDMDHFQSYDVCKKFPEKSFCFGSHMDTKKMKKFRETGCKNVYPRSVFLKKLEQLKQSFPQSQHL